VNVELCDCAGGAGTHQQTSMMALTQSTTKTGTAEATSCRNRTQRNGSIVFGAENLLIHCLHVVVDTILHEQNVTCCPKRRANDKRKPAMVNGLTLDGGEIQANCQPPNNSNSCIPSVKGTSPPDTLLKATIAGPKDDQRTAAKANEDDERKRKVTSDDGLENENKMKRL
jgi:hypothetical protein